MSSGIDDGLQDLHDGAGLSDATSPNGLRSNPIFEVSRVVMAVAAAAAAATEEDEDEESSRRSRSR